jgi:hypothetical protein
MHVRWQRTIPGVACLCLLAIPLGALVPRSEVASRSVRRRVLPAPRTPSEAALRQAKQHWRQAFQGIQAELETLCAEDPEASSRQWNGWRSELMAVDKAGYLQRAHGAAREAVELAQSVSERYQALMWLAIIECDRGHHRAELQHVQQLVTLGPRDAAAWGALARAAHCNGLPEKQRQAGQMLKELETPPTLPPYQDIAVQTQAH